MSFIYHTSVPIFLQELSQYDYTFGHTDKSKLVQNYLAILNALQIFVETTWIFGQIDDLQFNFGPCPLSSSEVLSIVPYIVCIIFNE